MTTQAVVPAQSQALVLPAKWNREELLKLTPEQSVTLILSLYRRDVAVLGQGECFVVRSKGKTSMGFKKSVRLSEAEGDLYTVSGKFMPSAQGYNKLNQVAGVSIVSPKTLIFEGKEQSNPYTCFADVERTRIAFVAVRRIALGRGPTGQWVSYDRTRLFNLATYHLQALQNKVKYEANSGAVGLKDQPPEMFKGKPLAYYPIDHMVGLYVDVSHAKIREVYLENTNRVKFAETTATTIAERTCLSAHPAIAVKSLTATGTEKNHVAYVTVYGWRDEIDQASLADFAQGVAEGTAEDVEYDKQEEAIEVEFSEEAEAVAQEARTEPGTHSKEEDRGEEPPPPDEEEGPKVSAERVALMGRFNAAKAKDQKKFFAVLKKEGVQDINKVPDDQLLDLVSALEEAVGITK